MEYNPPTKVSDKMVQIKINTPKVQSEEALARITQILHYMERIGRLRHGVMLPFGADITQMKAGDRLWQPWETDERLYIRGVRNLFGHARYRVLENGALRVRDRSPQRSGKPEIHGTSFDTTTTDWEWSAQEFLALAQRLEDLVLHRIQCYFRATVTCQICGRSVDGRERLTCGHVKYQEGPKGSLISKPDRGAVQIDVSIGYSEDTANELATQGTRGTITDEGLDQIISSLEQTDKIASEAAKKGAPIYEEIPD